MSPETTLEVNCTIQYIPGAFILYPYPRQLTVLYCTAGIVSFRGRKDYLD